MRISLTQLEGARLGSALALLVGLLTGGASAQEAGRHIYTGVYVTPDLGESVLADVNLAPLMDGVESLEDLRALVRINHEHGVDWIKARTTERSGLVDNDPRAQVYTEEQIRAVVDEATKLGMPVMIHAHGESGVRAAVLGGARSVEHATYASDETLRLFKARGTYLVPTLGSITSFGQPGDYADPAHLLRGLHMAPRRIEMVQRAYAMGIPIVTGADTGYGPESAARISRGMDRLVQLGMEPLDVIKAATSRAAELLQIEDRTGVVKPGLEADLLIVERNPFEHIRTLQDPLAIISNGQIVLNRVLEEAR